VKVDREVLGSLRTPTRRSSKLMMPLPVLSYASNTERPSRLRAVTAAQ